MRLVKFLPDFSFELGRFWLSSEDDVSDATFNGGDVASVFSTSDDTASGQLTEAGYSDAISGKIVELEA